MQIEQELEATHLLYEVIEDSILDGLKEKGKEIIRDKTRFTVIWGEVDELHSREVCIHYENVYGESAQKCETIQ
jgi:hypothetical protein